MTNKKVKTSPGRPSLEEIELGITAQELEDTMVWCGLIKIYSRKKDSEIECALEEAEWKLEGQSESEIQKKLNDPEYEKPSGRQFNRHRNGVQRMTHHELLNFVKKARCVGLLPPKRNFGTIVDGDRERRLLTGSRDEAGKTALLLEMTTLKELHDSKRSLAEAAERFQAAAQAAERHGLDIFDTPTPNPHRPPAPDAILETVDTMTIAKRINEIASWCFYRGQPHGLDETFTVKIEKNEPVKRLYKRRSNEDQKNAAAALLATHWCKSGAPVSGNEVN